jgi:RNA polymerase sigma-70 factor, ECF subfamily
LSNNERYILLMPEDISDYELIKSFINGDEASFNKIINKYKHKIYWHARRMTGNHLDADEVVQEVLLVMYKKLKDFQFKSELYTWIYRIVSTRSLNYLRKRSLRKVFSFDDPSTDSVSSNEDIAKSLEMKEKLKKINSLLQKLPLKQREVFILRHYEELSYEEISDLTGKSIGGLKANYFHGVNKILELMKNYEN